MEFEPKQKNKAPDAVVLCLFICALICLVSGNVRGIAGRSILQTAGLLFFAALIFILVKYKFTRLRYVIRKKAPKGYGVEDDGDALPDGAPVVSYPPSALELYIESAQGKRTFIGENVTALDSVVFFGKIPDAKAEKQALSDKYRKVPSFTYLKNMVGAEKYLLVWETDGELRKIIFEPDAKMAEYLSAVAAYNKEKGKTA